MVHSLPSLVQGVPLGSAVAAQLPPALQALIVHTLPSSVHGVPGGLGDQSFGSACGSQISHSLAGFTAPSARQMPPMKQVLLLIDSVPPPWPVPVPLTRMA